MTPPAPITSEPQISATLLLKVDVADLLEVPEATAAAYECNDLFEINDQGLCSTGSPAHAASWPYLTGQPLFFRTVVPPILVDVPAKGIISRHPDSPALRELCNAEIATLLRRFSPESAIETAPRIEIPSMPVVDAALEGYSETHFAGCDMIAVQHIYASTVGMLDALGKRGLDPSRVTVLGKSYSTNYSAARALLERGIRVPLGHLDQNAIDDHDELLEGAIRRELLRYRESVESGTAKPTLILLDDGGIAIDLVHREFPALLDRVVAVEQTTRGIRRIEKLDRIDCMIVNVGRAVIKTELEAPLIGFSLYGEVLRKLIHLETCFLPEGALSPPIPRAGRRLEDTVSILGGGGVVGQATAAAFANHGFRVRIFDKGPVDEHRYPEGVEVVLDRDDFLRNARVLLSVTGSAPITLDDYRLLPQRAKVFNGASSNDETDATVAIRAARLEQRPLSWWDPAWENDKAAYVDSLPDLLADREYVHPQTGWLWGDFAGSVIPLGHVARRAQRDRVLHFQDKEILLAKSGFVANLTDSEDSIPPAFIQVTRACLAAACAEAVTLRGVKGMPELSLAAQRRIERSYRAVLGFEAADGTPAASHGLEPRWRLDWEKTAPTIMRFLGSPKMPPELAPYVEAIVFPSANHVLRGGANRLATE